jgi:hypothetical protein|tara:strand:+ start:664 stop:957 length:294 start_codon:yes stop_codon:yes gene_type:complete
MTQIREPRLTEPRKRQSQSDPVVAGQQNQAVSFGELGVFNHVEANSLKVASTTGFIQLPALTTTQRNALTAVNGMVVYNSTDNKFQGYENGSWANLI